MAARSKLGSYLFRSVLAGSSTAPRRLLQHSSIRNLSSNPPPQLKTLTTTTSQLRCFCSAGASSNISYLKSDLEFSNSLQKIQDDGLPAIFYFTAAWCGPCRLMSPVLEDLSRKYPNVNIFKIDVDQKELEITLSDLKISSVPTFHFFHNGKKATEMIGADVAKLKKVMEDFYK